MTDRPIRVQLSRQRGWKMPPNTVKVDRSTKWGNPFVHYETRAQAVAAFRNWLAQDHTNYLPIDRLRIINNLHELRGKNLACWCPIDQPCHADVLLEMANSTEAQDG